MIDTMVEAVVETKAPLPYRMALTHVFRYFRVRFHDEESSQVTHTDTYNDHSLYHMDFSKVGGYWMKGRGAARI